MYSVIYYLIINNQLHVYEIYSSIFLFFCSDSCTMDLKKILYTFQMILFLEISGKRSTTFINFAINK